MIACSIAMITLNTGKTLRRALESVRDFEDIAIFDGNSTDGTQEIAREFGARVFSQSPGGPPNYRLSDFGAEKQKAVDAAKGPWVFILDSDEWMSPELVDEIRAVVSGPPTIGMIPRRLVLDGKDVPHAFFYPDRYPRLFHKATGAHFAQGRELHEKILYPATTTVVTPSAPLFHTWLSYEECLAKDKKNQDLAIAALAKKQFGFGQWFKWVVCYDSLVLAKVVSKMIFIWLLHPTTSLPWKWNWRVIRAELLHAWAATRFVLRPHQYD